MDDINSPSRNSLCKHIAAVMYRIGHRLDDRPELLFLLREVDHRELIQVASSTEQLLTAGRSISHRIDEGEDLAALFGIDIDQSGSSERSLQSEQEPKSVPKKAAAKKLGRDVAEQNLGKTGRKAGVAPKRKSSEKAEKPSSPKNDESNKSPEKKDSRQSKSKKKAGKKAKPAKKSQQTWKGKA
jgi:uncharacterized Zn finger protein